jgi:glycine hydroxymethyltransferase
MPILTTAHIARPATASSPLSGFLTAGAELLAQEDPQLHGAVCAEHAGKEGALCMLADTGVVDPSVLACMASVTRSVGELATGTERAAIEQLAALRAREAFGAGYANVLPHSTGAALAGVLAAVAEPGAEVLDLRGETIPTDRFPMVEHTLAQDDLPEVTALAERTNPAVLVAGGRFAPTGIDYARLREVADAVGAVLVADVSAAAGQVAAGTLARAAANPVRHAHVTVACTHARLFGPHGAVVLTAERDPTADAIARVLTWSWPGATTLPAVAGKARALHLATSELFRDTAKRMAAGAAQLAEELGGVGHQVRREEAGDHVVVLDLPPRFTRAASAVAALGEVNLTVGAAPRAGGGDDSGAPALRLGTATLAQRQFGSSEVRQIAELLDSVLGATRHDGTVDEFVRLSAYDSLRRLLSQFPLPCYVPVTQWEDHR